jgi:hypothetical protein
LRTWLLYLFQGQGKRTAATTGRGVTAVTNPSPNWPRRTSVHTRLDHLLQPLLSDAATTDLQEDRRLCHRVGAPKVRPAAPSNQPPQDWFVRLCRAHPTLFAHWPLCHGNGRTSAAVWLETVLHDSGSAPGDEIRPGDSIRLVFRWHHIWSAPSGGCYGYAENWLLPCGVRRAELYAGGETVQCRTTIVERSHSKTRKGTRRSAFRSQRFRRSTHAPRSRSATAL